MSKHLNQNTSPCFLSIVIPAYNEEERLPDSLDQITDFVIQQDYSIEVIVVDDGSEDRTADIVRTFQKEVGFISLLQVAHGGKGHAVRAGMLKAEGKYLFLCDSDLSMPIEEITKFLPYMLDGYDLAIGSRQVEGAHRFDEPGYRHLMGLFFNRLVRLLAVPGILDTQAGFKCFRSEAARPLFSQQTITGWGFDVEILFIAQKYGLRIAEVPITWYYRDSSKLRPIRDAYNMFREVLKVRLNDWRGRYTPELLQHSEKDLYLMNVSGEVEKFSTNKYASK